MPVTQMGTPGAEPLHPEAVKALVLAILSVTVLPPLGFWSVAVGRRVRRDVAAPGVGDQGFGTLALVLGWVGIGLTSLFVLAVVAALVAVAAFR